MICCEHSSTVAECRSLPNRSQLVLVVMVFTLAVSGDALAVQQPTNSPKPSCPSNVVTHCSPGGPMPNTVPVTVIPQESSTKPNMAQQSLTEQAAMPQPDQADRVGSTELDPAILSEIKAIRTRLGGGVAHQLEGIWDHSGLPDNPLLTDADNAATGQLMLESAFDDEIKQLAGNQDRSGGPAEPLAERQPSMAIRLRAAARYLDLAAAELEEVSQFSHADELRRQAHMLRLQAR